MLMGAQHTSHFLHRFQTTAQGAEAPVVQKSLRPKDRFVFPEVGERFLQLPSAARGQLARPQSQKLLPHSPAHPAASAQQRPAHVLELLGLGLPRRSQARTFCPAHFVQRLIQVLGDMKAVQHMQRLFRLLRQNLQIRLPHVTADKLQPDRKSTRLNSSHGYISYAGFCLKKKTISSPQPACSDNSYSA